ncbi:alpha-(1,3)-fucosyltransferase C-like [Choristoneura fumiferana]|uniref:alpha-(1,3)-fucosyltransferase C-like n=1 Tax=Choristoneura fumiferana TaxID=7141 RepID=UPI003D15C164
MTKQCKYTNCFISRDRNMLSNNYTNYNAILFGGKSLKSGFVDGWLDVPRDRNEDQIYIFAMQEDAETNPICHVRFDNYFNLTWTYKLDSDVIWPFFHVIDRLTHEYVAPKINTEWSLVNKQSDMIYEIQEVLLNKRDFGVWISNKCQTQSQREKIVAEIKEESDIHDHTLDILGACYSKCNNTAVASAKVLRPYTFFLAFESVLADDYVTGDVVEAIKQKCLPVVYGGANYSRFLPPHSYIDATTLGPRETVRLMAHLMTDVTRYFAYFDWHTSYAVKKDKGESACNLCEALNQKRRGSHVKLRKWWNPHYETLCSTSEAKTFKQLYDLHYQHQVLNIKKPMT